MKVYLNVLLAVSVALAPLAGFARQGGGGPTLSQQTIATQVKANIQALGNLNQQSNVFDFKLNGITLKAQNIVTSWSKDSDRYDVVTTAVVTQTPAEYSAMVNYVRTSVVEARRANIRATVINIIPDTADGTELTKELEQSFEPADRGQVLTLPLSQVELTSLEKKLVAKGGILGKLQQRVRDGVNWLTNHPKVYHRTFVMSRTLMNGTAASLSFLMSYSGIHPAIAVAAGTAAGMLSGVIQMTAKYYAPWLLRDGYTFAGFKKAFDQFLSTKSEAVRETWARKLSSLAKYSAIEVAFVLVPVSMFLAADANSASLESTEWLTSLVGPGFQNFSYDFNFLSFANAVSLSVFAQYPWDLSIARLNSIDIEAHKNDPEALKWVDFRTKGYFLGISAMSVLALAISFGNEYLGYSLLAGMGALGIHVGNLAVKKAKRLASKCEDFLVNTSEDLAKTGS